MQCENCGGVGTLMELENGEDSNQYMIVVCEDCNGTGKTALKI